MEIRGSQIGIFQFHTSEIQGHLWDHLKTSLVCFMAWLFLSSPVLAQRPDQFERINPEAEIQQSIIYSIAQDSFGNIWAGTEEGIIRYNSKETFLYNKYQGIEGNTQNRTTRIFIDAESGIWAATPGGVFKYIAEDDLFSPVLPKALTPSPALIEDLAADDLDQLWVGGFNGLWKYHTKRDSSSQNWERFASDLHINCLEYAGGILYIGSNSGLHTLDPSTDLMTHFPLSEWGTPFSVTSIEVNSTGALVGTSVGSLFRLLPGSMQVDQKISLPIPNQISTPVNGILTDLDSNLFVATDGGGLLHLDSEGNLIRQYANDPNDPASIASDGIYDILIGKENILWVATYGGGINYLNLARKNFYAVTHKLNDDNSLAHNFTRAILEDPDGLIWFGTKEGVSIWDREGGNWDQIPSLGTSSAQDIVMTLALDGNHIWAGTYGRGTFRIDRRTYRTTHYSQDAPRGRNVAVTKVYAIFIDQEKNCWIGGINEDVHCIQNDGNILTFPVQQVRDIIQHSDGSILTAGRYGVHRIINGEVSRIAPLQPGEQGLHYTTVTSLLEDKHGNLLVGTNGSGLIQYHFDSGNVRIIDPDDGLPSDIVQGILQDKTGQTWVSTTSGLVQLNLQSERPVVKVFDKGDGLPGNMFNYGSYARFSDGTLAFGGPDGVSLFNPLKINTQAYPPKIVFEDFQLLQAEEHDDHSELPVNINIADTIELRHYENAFRIKFIGILHSSPEKVMYSWKMDGLNDEWSIPNEEEQINFTNLGPGFYTFSVKAANRDGIWGHAKSVRILIHHPWWASTLAYIVYSLLIIGFLVALAYISNALIRKRNADEQIAFFSNITHELKTPLSVLLSSLENASQNNGRENGSNEKIRTTIHRLNTLFEQLLNFNRITSDQTSIQEVSKIQVESYIHGVIHSFKPLMDEKKISVEVTSHWESGIFYYDKETLNKILSNLISNAIKYSRENGKISVFLSDAGKDAMRIEIKDDGIGIPKDQQKNILRRYYRGRNAINSQLPGTGLGLMIVKNLIERDKGSISFESVENKGTRFTVILKNHPEEYKHSAILKGPDASVLEPRDKARLAEYSDAKILIVEDNDDLRQILVEKLGTYFQVFEAENGADGLEKVKSLYPDLVITDLIIPEMDGLELCQTLQSDINLNHILVFMMTVLSSSEYKLKSIESGVTTFLEKPIDINFLLAKIISTFDWQKKMHERYKHHMEMEDAEKFRNKRDAEFLNRLEKFVLEKIKEENLSVHDLCNFLGMSRTALYMKLKNLVDLSPQNFIIHTRLKYAKKLLIEKNLTIKEVAYHAGFSNPKYFSTSFKKRFKESPSSFLKSLQAE